ncbi:MAG: S8 family serine peptidase [Clostridiaceae bacterium]
MNKGNLMIDLFLKLPPSIKEKLAQYSNNIEIIEGKIELVVLYQGNFENIKNKLNQSGGNFFDLGYGYGIVNIEVGMINELENINEIIYFELPKILVTSFERANNASCINQINNNFGLTGEGVEIGFIDSGIDYRNSAFIDSNGKTRIDYIYDLNDSTVYSSDDINKAIYSDNPYEIVKQKDTIGHGTFVAGVAAAGGNISKNLYGPAYNSRLIMVKMTREKDFNYAKSTQLMRGIKFILDKMYIMEKPIVINISFSTNDGAHNGGSLLEKYIENVALNNRLSFVISAGNEGDSAHHVSGILKEKQTINFNIAPFEYSLIINMYKDILDDVSIIIKNPSGLFSNNIEIKQGGVSGNIGKDKYFIYYSGPKPIDTKGEIILSFVGEEEPLIDGQWSITIYNKRLIGRRYDLWMPISEGLNKNTKFLRPDPFNTLGIPATVGNVISVGSYNIYTGAYSSFSGRGDPDKCEVKPDLIAPGEEIESVIPGGIDKLSGTSMSAPITAGAVALMLEWGIVNNNDPFLYGERIKYYLLKGSRRNKYDLMYPNRIYGYGELCLKGAFDLMSGNLRQQVLSCGDLYVKENYNNYIVEYDGDIVKKLRTVQGACAFILDENYAVVSVEKSLEKQVLNDISEIVFAIKPYIYTLLSYEVVESANIPIMNNNPYLELTGRGVVVGIVDTGIDYLDKDFMYEDDTTRILSIWDQSEYSGNNPLEFDFGSEYTSYEINRAIQEKNNGGDPYAVVPSVDKIGHGTNVSKIAASRGTNGPKGAAYDAEIMMVKLKQAKKSTLEYNGIYSPKVPTYEGTDILLGLKYLVSYAKRLNRPMVIYIPLGTNSGGHDGSSIIERYVDEISKIRGIAVVTGCGNEGDSGTHFSGMIENLDDEVMVELKVDPREISMHIDIWCHRPDKVSLSIVSPSGEVIPKIPAKLQETEEIKFVFEGSKVYVKYFIPEEITGDELICVTIDDIRGGVWQFKLIGDYIVNGKFDAYIRQRSLLYEGTRFLNPNPYTTLTIPSTSKSIISTSFFNQINNSIIASSGRGYTRDGRIKPDLTSPSISLLDISGSSTAGAVLAGAVALLLQWGIVDGNDKTLYSVKIKTYLIRGTRKRPGDSYPNNEFGYGILDLKLVFENMRQYRDDEKVFIRIPKELYDVLSN